MRFKDIITEAQAQLDPYYQASLNGAVTFPNMDQYYELYRFSVLTASADAHGGFAVDSTHVLRDHPMTVAYSKEEQQMVADTAKALGKETLELTNHGSNEPKDTGTSSPVAPRREIWDLWNKNTAGDQATKVTQKDRLDNIAHSDDRLHRKETVNEGWREKAAAVAAAACVAGTPGCATTGSNTGNNEIIPTLNAIDRISRITKPGMRELGAQELKDLARGDRNNSAILRMLKKAEEDAKLEASQPVQPTRPQYYAIYTNDVPAVKYSDEKEAEQTLAELKRKFPDYKFEIRVVEDEIPRRKKIKESKIRADVNSSLPSAYVIPKLHNTDPYTQYRYGLALAAAQGEQERAKEGSGNDVGKESPWNQSFALVDYSDSQAEQIDAALKMVGLSPSDKKQITSKGSSETDDVTKSSPVASRKELKDLYKK